MRSTIFTSLALGLTTVPLAADEVLSCYTRSYSEAHLAQNPDQVVKGMVLAFYKLDEYDDTLAFVMTRLSEQGRLANSSMSGRLLDQFLSCYNGTGGVGTGCGVACDGGGFAVTKQTADSITLRVHYMVMGDPTEGCGGTFELYERQGETTSYRLNRADSAICEAMLP